MTRRMNLIGPAFASLALIAPAWGQSEDAAARLERLTSGVTPRDAQSQRDLEARVEALWKAGDTDQLKAIGESVGPILARLALDLDLEALLVDHAGNPVLRLIECAPTSSVDFFTSLSTRDRVLYEQLQRSQWSIDRVLRENVTKALSPKKRQELLTLAETTMGLTSIPLPTRIGFARRVLSDERLADDRTLDFLVSVSMNSPDARDTLMHALGEESVAMELGRVQSIAQNLAGHAGLSNSQRYRLEGLISARLRAAPPSSAERASATLALRGLYRSNEKWVSALMHEKRDIDGVDGGKLHLARALAALPDESVPAALDLLADSGLPEQERALFMRNSEAWTRGSAKRVMEAALEDQSRTLVSRLIAAHGLLNAKDAQAATVDRVADLIADIAADPAAVPDLIAALDVAQRIPGPSTRGWTRVTARLITNLRIPDRLADILIMRADVDSPGERSLIESVLPAAADRLGRAKMPMTFRNLRYFGLRAMADDPTLIQPLLVDLWLKHTSSSLYEFRVFVRLANSAGDPELTAKVADALEIAIAESGSVYEQKAGADTLLRLESADAVPRLIGLALASDSSDFTSHVEEHVTRTLNLRRAAAEWRTLASGGDTRAEATAKVLALLNSPNRDVRIEAIHGLGTLGAVETLPRLIELVASEDNGIKAAALSSLKRLREAPAAAKTD